MGASIQEGTLNVSVVVKVIDATTGIPDQALTFSDFAYWYRREVDPGSTPLAVQDTFTEVTQTVTGAHTDHGIVHLEEGNYRIDVDDNVFAAGAIAVTIGAVITGKIVMEAYHPIVAYDPMDIVRIGLTALPNAVVDAANGLATSAGGATGIDDLATPTNITGGTIATVTNVTTVDGLAANVITATSINADAITEAKIADNALANEHFAAAALTSAEVTSVGTAASIVGNVDGNVTGTVASVVGNVDGNVTGSVASNLELGPTEVNTQVADVMKVDTIAERTNAAPPTTPTFEEAISYLYMMLTAKIDVVSGFKEFYNNAGTIIWKKALSDDASNYVEADGEAGT